MPTGSGKTTVAAEVIRRAVDRGERVVVVVHRLHLVSQVADRLRAYGIEAARISGGSAPSAEPVQVAMVQTLARRACPPADLVIVDECHHIKAESYLQVLRAYPHARVIGMTATPFRSDGQGLGDMFDAIIEPTDVAALIDEGILVEPSVYAPSAGPNLDGLPVIAGDFDRRALSERMDRCELVGSIVDHWRELAEGKRTVAFAVSVAHSRSIVARFLAAGIPAEHVEARTKGREAIFARLARGETLVVSNVGIIDEGWDLPALEAAILARPTRSLGLHIQMVGRVMRAAEGKAAVVLDHAGNHLRLGLVTDRVEHALDGCSRARGAPSVGRCPACGIVARGRACPGCGADLAEAREPLIPFEKPGRLVRLGRSWVASRAPRYRPRSGSVGESIVSFLSQHSAAGPLALKWGLGNPSEVKFFGALSRLLESQVVRRRADGMIELVRHGDRRAA